MERLGPFESLPSIAAAVSGGADSTALAILAHDWIRSRGGTLIAFTVDHGLRPESAQEARLTIQRLMALGIEARLLTVDNLTLGPALAERARIMRYQALTKACRTAGCLHLLLGHHAGDQVETLGMRVLRGSRNDGLAGMAALVETPSVRLLRPLLAADPLTLRQFLTTHGIAWIEDPSNQDARALRSRLRQGFAGQATPALSRAAAVAGTARAQEERKIAQRLAQDVVIYPEGYAVLAGGFMSPGALSALLRMIGGAIYPPEPSHVTGLARAMRAGTVGGVRILPHWSGAWLVVREEAAIASPVQASAETLWDSRFRLLLRRANGGMIGKLGEDAARFRDLSDLPSIVLRTLPALRIGKNVEAVPHLGYGIEKHDPMMTVCFTPPWPAAGPVFFPAETDLSLPGCASPLLGEPSTGMGMQGW